MFLTFLCHPALFRQDIFPPVKIRKARHVHLAAAVKAKVSVPVVARGSDKSPHLPNPYWRAAMPYY